MQEKRQSYRCPIVKPARYGVLNVGESLIMARLVDESAGGLAVLVDSVEGLAVGQAARLTMPDGSCEVAIAHITEVEPSWNGGGDFKNGGGDFKKAADSPERQYRLGLRRRENAVIEEPPRVSLFVRSVAVRLTERATSPMGMIVWGVLLAATLVATLPGWVGSNRDGRKSEGDKPGETPASTDKGWVVELLRASLPAADANVPDPTPVGSSTLPKMELPMGGIDLRKLTGANSFALPSVVRELGLTRDQQKRIGQLVEATENALRSLQSQLRGASRQDVSRLRGELLDDAQRQAVKMLNDQQRARWDELHRTP